MAYNYGFSQTELNRIAALVQKHEAARSKAWHEYFKVAAETAAAKNVRVTDRALIVDLRDGRVVSVPSST